jgi:hypothetical protein
MATVSDPDGIRTDTTQHDTTPGIECSRALKLADVAPSDVSDGPVARGFVQLAPADEPDPIAVALEAARAAWADVGDRRQLRRALLRVVAELDDEEDSR